MTTLAARAESAPVASAEDTTRAAGLVAADVGQAAARVARVTALAETAALRASDRPESPIVRSW